MNKPYTYIIGWRHLDKWYYGSRWANNSTPSEDLFVNYFTSSSVVKQFIEKNGAPDVVRVMRTFENREDCQDHEIRFLVKHECRRSPRWLNRGVPGKYFSIHNRRHTEQTKKLIGEKSRARWADPTSHSMFMTKVKRGHHLSDEHKKVLSEKSKVHMNKPDVKAQHAARMKDLWKDENYRERVRESSEAFWKSEAGILAGEKIQARHKGKNVTEETRRRLSESRRGKGNPNPGLAAQMKYRDPIVCPHCGKEGRGTKWQGHLRKCGE